MQGVCGVLEGLLEMPDSVLYVLDVLLLTGIFVPCCLLTAVFAQLKGRTPHSFQQV